MAVVPTEGIRRGSIGLSGSGVPNRRRRPSNHEDRPSLSSEARNNTFGIYSSIESESLSSLQKLTSKVVREEILPEISRNRSPFCLGRFAIKDQMGVTFLRHSQMRHKIVQKELRNSEFKLRLVRDDILNRLFDSVDYVPVKVNPELSEWMDDHERTLALFIDHSSDGYEFLEEQQARLREILEPYSPALASRIKDPDHVKILKYGNGREINQLSRKEKNYCIERISQKMVDSGLTEILLSPIPNFGSSYNEPAPAWKSIDRKINANTSPALAW